MVGYIAVEKPLDIELMKKDEVRWERSKSRNKCATVRETQTIVDDIVGLIVCPLVWSRSSEASIHSSPNRPELQGGSRNG